MLCPPLALGTWGFCLSHGSWITAARTSPCRLYGMDMYVVHIAISYFYGSNKRLWWAGQR